MCVRERCQGLGQPQAFAGSQDQPVSVAKWCQSHHMEGEKHLTTWETLRKPAYIFTSHLISGSYSTIRMVDFTVDGAAVGEFELSSIRDTHKVFYEQIQNLLAFYCPPLAAV